MIRVYQLGGKATDAQRADAMLGVADVATLFANDQREATGLYEHVACVATDDLNVAYRLTNSIDAAWYAAESEPANLRVRPRFAGQGCRSTSVGDVLVTPSGVFAVARMGFELLDPLVVDHVRLPPKGAVITRPPEQLLTAVEFGNRLRALRPSVVGVKLTPQGTVRVRCKRLLWVDMPCLPYASDVEQAAAMLASADRQLACDDEELETQSA